MDKELISLRIDYVIKHIDLATDDIKNIALEDFDEYSLVARSVAFSLEQICEHITRLKNKLENYYPNINWKDIYDMRIILAHMYNKIDVVEVYNTVKNDLPILKKQMLEIKANL